MSDQSTIAGDRFTSIIQEMDVASRFSFLWGMRKQKRCLSQDSARIIAIDDDRYVDVHHSEDKYA